MQLNNITSEEMLLLLENIPYAMIGINKTGGIVKYTHSALKMFGFDIDDVFGKQFTTIVPEFDINQQVTVAIAYKKNGDIINVEVISRPSSYGRFLIIKEISNDYTQLLQYNTELEDTYNEIKQMIEEGDKEKYEFFENMTSELKRPINAILGFSYFIRDGLFGPINKKYVEYAFDIERASNELLDITSNILEVFSSKLIKKNSFAHFMIDDVILNNIIRYQPKCAKKQIIIENKLSMNQINMIGDKEKVDTIISNLLNNSIKFTPEKGKIIIECKAENDAILFSIQDTGIGIEQEHLKHIWKPFYRFNMLNNKKQGYTGNGLGLTVVKSLVDLHKGDIQIQSVVNIGTKVTITFPQTKDEDIC
jgi:signal transduction histidine kinase